MHTFEFDIPNYLPNESRTINGYDPADADLDNKNWSFMTFDIHVLEDLRKICLTWHYGGEDGVWQTLGMAIRVPIDSNSKMSIEDQIKKLFVIFNDKYRSMGFEAKLNLTYESWDSYDTIDER